MEKFFLHSIILESKSFNEYIKQGNFNPFSQDEIIISSYNFIRNKDQYVKAVKWDLIVIDEAHRLRNVYKSSNKVARGIRDALDTFPKILLKRHPCRILSWNSNSLVSFIDEYTFGDFKSFKNRFAKLSDDRIEQYKDLKERLTPICKRTLRKQVWEYINYTNRKASVIEQELQDETKRIEFIKKPEEKQKAVFYLEAKKNIVDAITHMNHQVTSISDLTKPKIKEIAINNIKNAINENPQQTLFTAEIIDEVEKTFDIVVDDYRKNIIEIPRISLVQKGEVKSGFYDFDLDVMNLNFQPSSEQIMIHRLSDGKSFEIETEVGKVVYDSLENMIVNELVNYSEIDYDQCSALLFKLARQAVAKLSTYLEEHGIINVIQSYKREVGRYIYTQMMEHFYCEAQGYEKPVVYPFDQIYPHNYSKYSKDEIYHYSTTINPTSDIPKKVFTGFFKSCHKLYKFDSKTEKDFAVILEQEKNTVVKWLRPAQKQFRIYWDHNSKQYHPDFVVECADTIYMVETKKATDINSDEVQAKKRAALEYCKNATEFTTKHGGKPWKYVLIPHGMVMVNMSFENLVKDYGEID